MNPKIPQFFNNPNDGQFRFTRNFNVNELGEANLYSNIWNESNCLHGVEVFYIERDLGEAEPIFGEYLTSKLQTATRMFLQADNLNNNGGWQNADIYSKLGLGTTDEETFTCPKITFSQAKTNPDPSTNETQPYLPFYPKQGDLVYHVNSKKLFEVSHVEDEVALGYIFGNRNAYQLKCKVYMYDHSQVSTDVSMPSEIQALDLIKTINQQIYDVETQEKTAYNNPISTEAESVVDDTEEDALF